MGLVTFVGLQSWVLFKPRRKSFTWEGKSRELKPALGLSLKAHVCVHGYSQSNKHSFHLMANSIKNTRWVNISYTSQAKMAEYLLSTGQGQELGQTLFFI